MEHNQGGQGRNRDAIKALAGALAALAGAFVVSRLREARAADRRLDELERKAEALSRRTERRA